MNIGYQKVGRWYAIRKVEFFPFDIYLVNEGYVRGKNPALRWRFKNVFFYYENEFEHSFRGAADMQDLQKFLQKNCNRRFTRRVGKAIRSSADKLLLVTQRTFVSKNNLVRYLNQFYRAFATFAAVFQTPELAQMLTPEKDRAFLYQFGLARDYAARVLAKVERIYRSRLGALLRIAPHRALMLLPDEVKEVIRTNTLPRNFKQRRTCAILTLNDKTRVYWNREADVLFAREILRHQRSSRAKELHGQVAYHGIVRGRVYVAFNADDFKRIPRGAILVCSMTRYTIVPYLKRVSAIITDQGGITCHAAIMARELNVPTVIGVQSATDTLKTGDRVEVDGEKGIVRRVAGF